MHTNEIVCVHTSMDETIEDDGKIDVTIVKNICVKPVKEKDGSMMINV